MLTLSEKDKAMWWSNEKAIVYNFGTLPENAKNSLDRLPELLQQVIEVNVGISKIIEGISKFIEHISRFKESLQTLYSISNTLSKNSDFVKILNELCVSENENVRSEAVKSLKVISDNSKGKEMLKGNPKND